MKQRKFSFDIPRLKIGPSRSDNRALKDQLAFQPDSPPLTPKSVRPPLPSDIEAELRLACTHVLQGFKASSQLPDGQKPQLDYAAIRGAPRKELEPPSIPLSKLSSNEHLTAKPDPAPAQSASSDAYRYKPNTATEDLFRHDTQEQKRRSRAVSRVDQLMVGPPKPQELKPRDRAESHSRSKSNPHPSGRPIVSKPEQDERPRTATRATSTETTGSTPQTDSTDYPWSASTAMTSASATPARGSKRTSTQEAISIPRLDVIQGDWMRLELEKHKRAHEEENAANDTSSGSKAEDQRSDSKSPVSSSQVPTPIAKVPTRKPVPRAAECSDIQTADASRTDSLQPQEIASPDSQRTAFQLGTQHAEELIRSESRQGREATRAGDDVRSRALSRARSIKRGVQEYVRSASRSRQPGSRPDNIPRHGRSQSRTRNAANHVKEYFRPGSSAGSRKPSLDISNSLTRSMSQDSLNSEPDASPNNDSRQHKFKQWKPFHNVKASLSSENLSRPGSSGSNGRGRSANREVASNSAPTKSKPPIDLNRELPPLPSLDSWQDQQPEPEPEPTKPANLSSTASPISSHASAAKVGRSGKDKHQHNGPTEADDILAARMGSPVLRRAAKSDDTNIYRYSPQRAPPPPPPTNAPPDPPTSHLQLGDYDLPSQHTSTIPKISTPPASLSTIKATRRRSKTNQDPIPPSLSEKLRQASASSPDGKPIVAAGRAQLVNTNRNTGATGLGTKLGRALSTRRGHVAPPPSDHQRGATSANTPTGHSRNNSDLHRLPRKMSMDEYGRNTLHKADNHPSSVGWHSGTSSAAPKSPALSQAGKKTAGGKKWWQLGGGGAAAAGLQKGHHWMDQVVKNGAHSGALVGNDGAGAPIVRY